MSKRIIPVRGGGWSKPLPAAQGTRQDPRWTGRPSSTGCAHPHPHTHSDWDSVDTPIHSWHRSLGCGRKPEHAEKIPADMGRTCTLHTVAPARNWVFSHQHYNQMTQNEMTLLKDLLYWLGTNRLKDRSAHYVSTGCFYPSDLLCDGTATANMYHCLLYTSDAADDCWMV